MAFLKVEHIQKVYTTRFSSQKTEALRDVDFSVEEGEFVSVMGESGSGKSTLLNILATLDKPSAGEVIIGGQRISDIPDKKISDFRRQDLGFVFQDFNLLDSFSLKDNILLPMVLSNRSVEEMESKIKPIARTLGISGLLEKYPYEVSGGQKQRAAVARALINEPKLILADEPTGALDSKSSQALLETFEEINENGQTIVMVTHSTRAAAYSKRVLFIQDGVVYHEIHRGDQTAEQFMEKIAQTLMLLANRGDQIEW